MVRPQLSSGWIGSAPGDGDAPRLAVEDPGGVEAPFGGYKRSGIRREKGLEALRHYTRTKTVIAHVDDSA